MIVLAIVLATTGIYVGNHIGKSLSIRHGNTKSA